MIRRSMTMIAAALAFVPAPAPAQIIDAAKVVAGAFEVSNSDRNKTCMVTLKAEGAATAMKVELDKACAVPAMKDVTAWVLMPDDAVTRSEEHTSELQSQR